MAPLTWRNVDAPNFSGVNDSYRTVGLLLRNATDALNGGIEGFQEGQTQRASAQLMNDIMKNRNPAELEKAMAAGILGSNDPRYITPEALKFAAGYGDQLAQNELARQKLALASSTALRGGGRGGRAGAEDFVDVNGPSGIGGYVNNAGEITTTPVGTSVPTLEDVPATQKVSQLPTDIVSEVVAAADPETITQELPTRESTVGAPAVSVANTMPVASFSNDPIQDIVNSVRPVAGPIRIGTPRGRDGLNQRNSEMTADLANMRLNSYVNGPEESIASWGQNPRLLRNATSTNALVGIENEIKAAAEGQQFRKGALTERELIRKEEDELRGRSITEDARDVVDPLVISAQDAKAAKANLSIEEMGPARYNKAIELINQYDKDGAWSDFSRPNNLTATNVEPTNIDILAPNKKQEKKAEPATNTDGTAVAVPEVLTTRSPVIEELRKKSSQAEKQFAIDQSGNITAGFDANFLKVSADNRPLEEVVDAAIGEGGILKGKDYDSVLAAITQYMDTYKVKPAAAALAIANATAPETLTSATNWNDFADYVPDIPWLGIKERNEVNVDSARINQLLGSITNPATGELSAGESGPTILQNMENWETSTQARAETQRLVKEAEAAQIELERRERLKASGRSNLDNSDAVARRDQAVMNAQTALDSVMGDGGAARLYRGNAPAPRQAEEAVEVIPNRGQAPGIIPAEITARATAIYQQLVERYGKVPNRQEDLALRRQARELAISNANNEMATRLLARAARGN